MDDTKTIADEIEHVLTEMESMEVGSKEYLAAVQTLKTLSEARQAEANAAKIAAETRQADANTARIEAEAKSFKKPHLVEPEVLVAAGTNLLGILLVLYYEKLDVVSTKALGFISKVKP